MATFLRACRGGARKRPGLVLGQAVEGGCVCPLPSTMGCLGSSALLLPSCAFLQGKEDKLCLLRFAELAAEEIPVFPMGT